MSVLLDLLGTALLLIFILIFWKRPLSDALLSLAAFLLALTVAALACKPLAEQVGKPWLAPVIEQNVAGELADLFSAPHLETGEQTVAPLHFDQMVQEQPPAYLTILERYVADPDAVRAAYQTVPQPTTLLYAISNPMVTLLTRSASFVVLWIVSALLFWLISRRIAHNLPPPSPVRGWLHIPSAAVGLLAGLLVVFGVQVLLCWLMPVCSGRFLFLQDNTAARSVLHNLLRPYNLFWQLLFR